MILVTGGTGLVGAHLLLDLLKTGNKIRAIHRKNSDLEAVRTVFSYELPAEEAGFLFNQIEWYEASLEDIPALTEAFKAITRVYHCAALVSFDSGDATALRKTNIEGTANIVNLCIASQVEKLCYISSIATMGLNIGEEYVTENFTWHPEINHSEYAISKHGAEIEVWRASQEGIAVIILNPGIILGPGFWDKGTGQIFKKIDTGFKFNFPKTTGFVGVKDVANAALVTMNSTLENKQYIIVSENLSFKEVFYEVAGALGKPAPDVALKPWMVSIGWLLQSISRFLFGTKKQLDRGDHKTLFEHKRFSNKKIKEELSFEFTPVKQVIGETVKAYQMEKLR